MDVGVNMRIVTIVLLLVLSTLISCAEVSLKNPFLWKVEKDKQVSYLFGTMHVADPALSHLPLKLKEALAQSDGVRTEIDMHFMNQLKMSQLMLRKDGKTLKTLLPKALYKRTEAYLKRINPALDLTPFAQLKIWALAATLEFLENQLKYPNLKVIDDLVFMYGEEHNKSVGGIETIEEQVGYFDAFTLEENLLMLESILDFLDKEHNYMQKMKNLYIEGEAQPLLEYAHEQFKKSKYKTLEKKFMEVLLYNRNKVMAERIDNLLKENREKSYLFAFGVMHFLDKKSVIEYLEQYGYKVTRM